MPPGDDCLTLQLHGDLGAVTLRVPSGHAGGAADEGSLRGAVQAWAARSKQSETELLVDVATVRARRDALATVLRRLRARLPRRLQRNAEAADWRPAAAILSDSLRTRTFRPEGCDAEANFARRPSLSAVEVPPATLRVQAATLCAGDCNHMSWRLPPHVYPMFPRWCYCATARWPRPRRWRPPPPTRCRSCATPRYYTCYGYTYYGCKSCATLRRAATLRTHAATPCIGGCNHTLPGCNPMFPGYNPMRLGCNPMHACRRTVARRRSSYSAAWHVQTHALVVPQLAAAAT